MEEEEAKAMKTTKAAKSAMTAAPHTAESETPEPEMVAAGTAAGAAAKPNTQL